MKDLADMPVGSAADTGAPKCILIGAIDNVGSVHTHLMKQLKQNYGTRFIIWGGGPAAWPDYAAAMTDDDGFVNPSFPAETGAATDAEVYRRAAAYEEKYGITYMRDVIQMDRRYSGGFNPSTYGSTRSLAVLPPLVRVYEEINQCFAWFEALFEEKEVDGLILRPDYLHAAPAIWIAVKRGIPVTFTSAANYGTYVTWLCGPFMERGFVQERMSRTEPNRRLLEQQGSSSLVPGAAKRFFDEADRLSTVGELLRRIYTSSKNAAAHMVQDVLTGKLWKKSRRIPLWRSIESHFRVFRIARYLKGSSLATVEDVASGPYILFLLQVEPEYSTLCLSREFSFTEAIIYQLAMCMPAGVRLVVKEHIPNIGNRPLDFYRRISRLPNVHMADYRLPGNELTEKAVAVSTISGSVGKQSTLIGKPAIIFAAHVDYSHMPNIRVVRSFHDLPEIMAWAVAPRDEATTTSWRTEGARLYGALTDISFDCPGIRLFGASGKGDVLPEHQGRIMQTYLDLWHWQKRNGIPV